MRRRRARRVGAGAAFAEASRHAKRRSSLVAPIRPRRAVCQTPSFPMRRSADFLPTPRDRCRRAGFPGWRSSPRGSPRVPALRSGAGEPRCRSYAGHYRKCPRWLAWPPVCRTFESAARAADRGMLTKTDRSDTTAGQRRCPDAVTRQQALTRSRVRRDA
jgi:hypothetical protein